MLTFFRLFYLYQETLETYIEEEKFFKCCKWFAHTVCGIVTAMLVGDSFLLDEYDSSIIHKSCAKLPKWILVEQSQLTYYNSYVTVIITLVFVCLGLHFAIFLQQRQLERQQSVPDYSVTYNVSDVKIIWTSKKPSNRILWRFRRNVISPLGSFSSFLVTTVYNLLHAYILLTITRSGPSVLGELHLFSIHSVYFFCLNLIESIFSPTLRNSLINVMPWSRDEHHVAVIV